MEAVWNGDEDLKELLKKCINEENIDFLRSESSKNILELNKLNTKISKKTVMRNIKVQLMIKNYNILSLQKIKKEKMFDEIIKIITCDLYIIGLLKLL